jgi:signal transduction histidine kinase/CheY-like chemotaxis protein
MFGEDVTAAVVRLALPAERQRSAAWLAAVVGAEELLAFVTDREVEALVPAPGFPQTIRGGPSWVEFLASSTRAERSAGCVEMPVGTTRTAVSLHSHGLVLVLVGGAPQPDMIDAVVALLPMVAQALTNELRVQFAEAAAEATEQSARRVLDLVHALEEAWAQAWELNAQLTDEHRQRDNFLAMLAHELRNPLAPLVTSLAVLRLSGTTGAHVQLDIMERQLRQLSRLVDDLLDVSRVKHGKIELRNEPVRLADVLAGAIESSRPTLDTRAHVVQALIPDDPWFVNGDAVRLMQIFSNLLHNAAKYTNPGGRIAISMSRDAETVVVRVTDNGVGIDPQMLPTVFDLFVQAPVSFDRCQGGLGIGLTLVRSLVELHHGTVVAESAGRGKGSTFEVRLPLLDVGSGSIQPVPAARALMSTESVSVLVVDDNRDLTESLAMLLRTMGHRVGTAHSGLHALEMARDLDPDLVLLDIGLPDMDGYEAGRRLRNVIRHNTPLVAMTGYGSSEDRQRSSEAGFDAHMVKPVAPEDLASLIGRLSNAAATPAAGG